MAHVRSSLDHSGHPAGKVTGNTGSSFVDPFRQATIQYTCGQSYQSSKW